MCWKQCAVRASEAHMKLQLLTVSVLSYQTVRSLGSSSAWPLTSLFCAYLLCYQDCIVRFNLDSNMPKIGLKFGTMIGFLNDFSWFADLVLCYRIAAAIWGSTLWVVTLSCSSYTSRYFFISFLNSVLISCCDWIELLEMNYGYIM